MPATSGMAFVIVTHLAPEQESYLTELIQPYTVMPVQQVCAIPETLDISVDIQTLNPKTVSQGCSTNAPKACKIEGACRFKAAVLDKPGLL